MKHYVGVLAVHFRTSFPGCRMEHRFRWSIRPSRTAVGRSRVSRPHSGSKSPGEEPQRRPALSLAISSGPASTDASKVRLTERLGRRDGLRHCIRRPARGCHPLRARSPEHRSVSRAAGSAREPHPRARARALSVTAEQSTALRPGRELACVDVWMSQGVEVLRTPSPPAAIHKLCVSLLKNCEALPFHVKRDPGYAPVHRCIHRDPMRSTSRFTLNSWICG